MSRGFLALLVLCSCATKQPALDLEVRDESVQPSAGAVVPGAAPHPTQWEPGPEDLDHDPEPPEIVPIPVDLTPGTARPRLKLVDPRRGIHTRGYPDEDDWVWIDSCDLSVVTYDFPAVTTDGALYVHRWLDQEWESDGGEGNEWIYDGTPEPYEEFGAEIAPMDRNGEAVHLKLLDEGDVPRRGRRVHCKAMRKLLRAEIERVNATLRKYEWRAMSKPEDLGIRTPWSYANAELASQPPGKRPLQYIEHQKHLILRDPGVQVLHDAATGWTTADPDCTNTPSVEALVIDLPTGLALTRLYSRCTCFGSEAVETHVLRLSDRARAEIIQRAPVGRAVLTAEEA